ncbi:MAG: glycosyltransferase family 4 protein [Calditrichaeota bacterium]|nr:glycosyltransferase family 4 protein [Calditrichota bacterium]
MQRIVKFLKYWDYSAYRVSVVTVKSSHSFAEDPTLLDEIPVRVQVIRSGSLDPFRLASLFKRILPFKRRNPSELVYESAGFWRRLAMRVFIPDSRLLWLPFALWKLWRLHRHQPIDVLFASMPPFTTGLIAALWKRWAPGRLILDFRDAWTENPYLPEIGSWHRNITEWLERLTIQQADGYVFVNPLLAEYYRQRYPLIEGRAWQVIRNGYDPDDLPKSPRSSPVPDRSSQFRLGILGTIYSQGNRPLSLLQAIRHMLDNSPELAGTFRLVFIGKWSPDFLNRFRSYRLEGVSEFIPYLPHRQALQEAARLDALALAIEGNLVGSERVTPGRIYEHLALRKPILAMCPLDGDLAELIRQCQAGEVVPHDDVEGIKRVLAQWLTYPERSREKYRFERIEQFERSVQTRQLMEFVRTILTEEDPSSHEDTHSPG